MKRFFQSSVKFKFKFNVRTLFNTRILCECVKWGNKFQQKVTKVLTLKYNFFFLCILYYLKFTFNVNRNKMHEVSLFDNKKDFIIHRNVWKKRNVLSLSYFHLCFFITPYPFPWKKEMNGILWGKFWSSSFNIKRKREK